MGSSFWVSGVGRQGQWGAGATREEKSVRARMGVRDKYRTYFLKVQGMRRERAAAGRAEAQAGRVFSLSQPAGRASG